MSDSPFAILLSSVQAATKCNAAYEEHIGQVFSGKGFADSFMDFKALSMQTVHVHSEDCGNTRPSSTFNDMLL